MTVDAGGRIADGTRIGALWAAILLGPFAVLAGLEVGYIFADRACRTGDVLPVHLTALAAFLLSLYAAALGWREWRRWGGAHAGDEGGAEGRSRFLALLGLLTGGFAALLVLAQWSATLFFHPCQ